MRAVTQGTDDSATGGRGRGWEFFRRKIAPVIFIVVLGLLATRTCRSEAQRLTVVIDFGASRAQVRALAVDYFRDGEAERVAHMRAEYGPGGAPGPARQELQLDRGAYTARIVVTTDSGPLELERRLVVEEQEVARIQLDLASP